MIELNPTEPLAPITIAQIDGSEASFLAQWDRLGEYPDDDHNRVRIFVDGSFLANVIDSNQYIIGGLRPDVLTPVDLIASTGIQQAISPDPWELFAVADHGLRIKLEWNAVSLVDNPDFEAFILYWSSDGSSPTEVLDEVFGADSTIYITDQLEEGIDYKFKLELRDIYGLVSSYSNIVTKAVNGAPKPPTDVSIGYSSNTRKASFIALAPGDQHPDIAGYAFYSNNISGEGSQRALVLDPQYRIGFTYPGHPITLTTSNLFAGKWIFCVRAVDQTGFESEYEELHLTLVMDGDDLVEAPITPDPPIRIVATTLAGGIIQIVVTLSTTEDTTGVRVYIDGSPLETQDAVEDILIYTFLTTPLNDGQLYEFYATALNGATESLPSDTVSAYADTSAPTGDTTLTATVVN